MLEKLRRFLAQSFHQGLAIVEERKVDKNELTISLARVCCGSSGISWASLSTRVWLMRRGGRLIKMSLPSVLHVCTVAAQASPG